MRVNEEQVLEAIDNLKRILPSDFSYIIEALEKVIKAEFVNDTINKDQKYQKNQNYQKITYVNNIDFNLNDLQDENNKIYDKSLMIGMGLIRYKLDPEYYSLWVTNHLINQLANSLHEKYPKYKKAIPI